ncbi:helix-turn-helix domain-containing protein [Chitiniphilus eburneus]|uniref:helix-turn-helix domain-containing protein n=1 Tax=Chitiniphilus eburneus TaxID=2571148 RepID=UPI001B7F9BD5|nr:helix-turn-helix domain-containing protein [Chitiniphilus eburneus]
MARPSKLTDAQWEAIGKRLLQGESAASLAREYGISKAAISARFSERTKTVKTVANQIVETERALSLLNVSEQIAAFDLAAQLRSISTHLASAANLGAITAHRLSALANTELEKVDDVDPMASAATLQSVAVLTKMANSSSEIALNLLKANKEKVDELNRGETPRDRPPVFNVTFGEQEDGAAD